MHVCPRKGRDAPEIHRFILQIVGPSFSRQFDSATSQLQRYAGTNQGREVGYSVCRPYRKVIAVQNKNDRMMSKSVSQLVILKPSQPR